MNAETREVTCVRVTSRLNGSKYVAAEVFRTLKAEKNVWLMFVQGKWKQKMYAIYLERLKTNKLAIIDLVWEKLQ